MIKITETKDYAVIAGMVNSPGFKEWLIDKKDDVVKEDLEIPNTIYYLFEADGIRLGFGALRKIDKDTGIVDVAFLSPFRGWFARDVALLAIDKYKLEGTCKQLITRISKKNKRSLYFTKWLGFVKYADDDNYIYLRLPLWVEQ